MEDYLVDLEGRSKNNAISKLTLDGYDYRIVREDNTNYMITCDFNLHRINLEIEDDIVVIAGIG